VFSHREWHKKRFAENADYREKVRASQRRYRQTHKEEMRERRRHKWETDPAYRDQQRARNREWQRRKRYQEVYGMSLAYYDAMLQRQRGVCAICGKSNDALCVDHCHACGKVRGLLRAKCNRALSFCNDDPAHLLAAISYLLAARDDAQAGCVPAVTPVKTDEPSEQARGAGALPDARHCPCAGKAV
jgi:hypothetical protein